MAQHNVEAAGLSITPAPNTANAGGDYILPAAAGARYVTARWINASGVSINIVLDDPTSVTPTSATAYNPDVTITVPAGATRKSVIDTYRFTDPTTGRVNWTYSATPTSVTTEFTAVV